jgi:hypothetical protein
MGAHERRPDFAVARIRPASGGNQGSVTATVIGSGFVAGAAVAMTRAGQPDIGGSFVNVDRGGSAINATFDLTNRATGPWGVVVVNPNASSRMRDSAFVVESGGAPDLWVDVTGIIRRPGQLSTVMIAFGNRGTVDALGVTMQLTIPANFQARLSVPIESPPAQPGEVRPDWEQVSPLVAVPGAGGFLHLPLYVPVIPGGRTGVLPLTLTLPPDAEDTVLTVALGETSATPAGATPAFVADAARGARDFLQQVFGLTVPASLDAAMQQYAAAQFGAAIANGRSSFAATSGVRPAVYSLVQLQLDLALYAAVRTGPATPAALATGRR